MRYCAALQLRVIYFYCIAQLRHEVCSELPTRQVFIASPICLSLIVLTGAITFQRREPNTLSLKSGVFTPRVAIHNVPDLDRGT